ncbi:thioredoxin family protein [Pedobacter sp. N23S346]|uniref:thioredoxin family protein n=1 Tax=Pedobacter sp. N23S346 TaxID=3402750 RepID=UPI003AC6C0C7
MSFKEGTPPSADAVLKAALKEAKQKKKKVFIMFHASWCGWCHKMDKSMNDPLVKAYFDDNFIIKHLTVYEHTDELKKTENPGSEDLMKKYNSEGYGIPLWFIFDTNGKLLVDSHIRPEGTGFETKGSNIIGCPSSKEEVEEFIKILKQTTKLNDNDLEKVTAVFRKNDPKFKG